MSRRRSRLRNALEVAAYRAARGLAHHLGARGRARLGAAIGSVYHTVGGRRREILRHNLALAFPALPPAERDALERAVARHFGRVTLDALALQRTAPEALLAAVRIEGREHLEEALAGGRGVFLLSAHIGSWEVAALVAGLIIPGGFAVVNRPLDNPHLEAELARLRSRFGNRALGKRNISREMLRQLKGGGAVGILIDQRALPEDAVEVPFFGHRAQTHVALARLALRTGVPIVPIWGLWDAPGRYTVRFEARIDPAGLRDEAALTALLTRRIEAVIRERPDQWLWYHDRWRELRLARSEDPTPGTPSPPPAG